MKIWLLLFTAISLSACSDYTEVEREIGYKGKARINPWLAAEKFSAQYGGKVRSLATWTAPEYGDSLWFVPASILSNESFTRQIERWVDDGGHLVLLVENADSETSDWSGHESVPDLEKPLFRMLERSGIKLNDSTSSSSSLGASKIELGGKSYNVDAHSKTRVSSGGGEPGVFASVTSGQGRISVLTDARIFRNRWIGDKDHAALLDGLVRITDYQGNIGFVRGSAVSLWGMLSMHLWPVLIGLAVLIILWLWKNFARFGPVEAVAGASVLRGYEHHLEALGDFQWRLDRGAALLNPLRSLIVERGQRVATRAGRRDDDFFQFLADRTGLTRERVHRALAEPAPPDSALLTRTTADLQLLLQVLH